MYSRLVPMLASAIMFCWCLFFPFYQCGGAWEVMTILCHVFECSMLTRIYKLSVTFGAAYKNEL